MGTKQESISIDNEQKKEILRYMDFTGIKSLSGGVRSLIHVGLHNINSSRNDRGGVVENSNISDGINNQGEDSEDIIVNFDENNPPSCFGIPGTGDCERPCNLKLACAINYSNSFKKKLDTT